MDSKLFEDILNEANLLQKAGQTIANAGNTLAAKANVKKAQAAQNAKQTTDAAKQNTDAAKNVIATLQSIANEQKQFDADTIKSLMDSINALNIGDDVKKSINHILNNQNTALQKQQNQTENNQQDTTQQNEQPNNQDNAQQQQAPQSDGQEVVNLLGKFKDGSNKADTVKNMLLRAKVTKQQAIDWISAFLK